MRYTSREKKRQNYDATQQLIQQIAGAAKMAFSKRASQEAFEKQKQIYAQQYADIMQIFFAGKTDETLRSQGLKLFYQVYEKYVEQHLGIDSEFAREQARANKVAEEIQRVIFTGLKNQYKTSPQGLEELSQKHLEIQASTRKTLEAQLNVEPDAVLVADMTEPFPIPLDMESITEKAVSTALSSPVSPREQDKPTNISIAASSLPKPKSVPIPSPHPTPEQKVEEMMTEAQAQAIIQSAQTLVEELKYQAFQMTHTVLPLSQQEHRKLQHIRDLYQALEKELKYRDSAAKPSTKDESMTHQIRHGLTSFSHTISRKLLGERQAHLPDNQESTFSKITRARAIKQYLSEWKTDTIRVIVVDDQRALQNLKEEGRLKNSVVLNLKHPEYGLNMSYYDASQKIKKQYSLEKAGRTELLNILRQRNETPSYETNIRYQGSLSRDEFKRYVTDVASTHPHQPHPSPTRDSFFNKKTTKETFKKLESLIKGKKLP